MSNNPAGPTLAEGTIVERKGDDIRDRQAAESLHFRRDKAPEAKADTTVTVDVPDGPFLAESKDDPFNPPPSQEADKD